VSVFVIKLDPSGNLVWSREFNDSADLRLNSMDVDESGNVLLTGGFATQVDFGGGVVKTTGGKDVFVALLSAAGEHIWSAGFGDTTGGADLGLTCAFADAKNVAIAGSFAGSMSFGGSPLTSVGNTGMFLAKLLTP
jgi:hypothetical protein